MISIAGSTNEQPRPARLGSMLVLEPPRHSRLSLVFLSPGKHLIGSSNGCGIRINVEGVQPRHAIILVGEQKILLKALDAKTWINDNIVTESALRAGDQISIGPITFVARSATAAELFSFTPTTNDFSTLIEAEEPVRPVESVTIESPSATHTSESTKAIDEPAVSEWRPFPETVSAHERTTPPVANRALVAHLSPAAVREILAPTIPSPVASHETGESKKPISFSNIVAIETVLKPIAAEQPFQELQNQIAALNEQAEVYANRPEFTQAPYADSRIAVQEEELKHLAADLSKQSQQLQERESQVAEGEADLQRKQQQLAFENERLIHAAQTTRRELSEQFARQMTLWQEWDASYRRSTAELKSQLETIEQRRAGVQIEVERLARERMDLQRMQAEFDDERRAIASERVQATKELAEIHSRRAVVETEHRNNLAELREHESRLANERQILAAAQDDLLAARQQIEHDRGLLAAEQSSESLRRERELQDRSQAQTRVNNETTALQALRVEIEADRHALETRHAAFVQEHDKFAAVLADVDHLREQLNRAEIELARYRQLEQANHSAINVVENVASSQNEHPEPIHRSFVTHPPQPESGATSIRDEQQSFAIARPDFVAVAAPPHNDPILFTTNNSTFGKLPVIESRLAKLQDRLASNDVHGTSAFENEAISELSLTNSSLPWEAQPMTDASIASAVIESPPSIDETLSDINQRFGYISSKTIPEPAEPESFKSWISTSVAEADVNDPLSPSSISPIENSSSDETSIHSPVVKPISLDATPSLSNLRAQLAQMFDLPKDDQRDEPVRSTSDIGEIYSDRPTGNASINELIEPTTTCSSSNASQVPDRSPTASVGLPSETVSLEPVQAAESPKIETPPEAIEEETDWTRRLRELSAVAGVSQSQPPSAPVAKEPEPDDKSVPEEEDEEYSVEAQLARLLGRPKPGSSSLMKSMAAVESKPAEHESISLDLSKVCEPAIDETVSDRSHLAAEPKHRQNKNAVRDEVRSFREVAQMSARTALAKHSRNSLRNDFYFSLGLTGIASIATAWYFGAYAFGSETQIWNGVSCALAMLLSSQKLIRSTLQLKNSRIKSRA